MSVHFVENTLLIGLKNNAKNIDFELGGLDEYDIDGEYDDVSGETKVAKLKLSNNKVIYLNHRPSDGDITFAKGGQVNVTGPNPAPDYTITIRSDDNKKVAYFDAAN